MEDEEQLCFFDQGFLAVQQLTATNILDYFAISQFYDRGCVNEILKMQSQFANIDISHRLTNTPGFYYIVEHEAEGLFIIAKKKFDNGVTTTLCLYYSIHGHIYRAPTTVSFSEARLADSLWNLNEALDKHEEQKTFSWIKGFQFGGDRKPEDSIDEQEARFLLEALHDYEKSLRESN